MARSRVVGSSYRNSGNASPDWGQCLPGVIVAPAEPGCSRVRQFHDWSKSETSDLDERRGGWLLAERGAGWGAEPKRPPPQTPPRRFRGGRGTQPLLSMTRKTPMVFPELPEIDSHAHAHLPLADVLMPRTCLTIALAAGEGTR